MIGAILDIPTLNRANGLEEGQSWEIVATTTTQHEAGHTRVFQTICTLQAIDSEAENLDKDPIKVNLDNYDYIEI